MAVSWRHVLHRQEVGEAVVAARAGEAVGAGTASGSTSQLAGATLRQLETEQQSAGRGCDCRQLPSAGPSYFLERREVLAEL